jgi:hypothetical protein
VDEGSDATSILLGVRDKLHGLSVRFELAPEQGHASCRSHGLTAKPRRVVWNDVVERDDPIVAHQPSKVQVVASYSRIGVITVDEQHVYLLISDGSPHCLDNGCAAGVAINEMGIDAGWRKKPKKRSVSDSKVNADESRDRGEGSAEHKEVAA